MSRRDRKPENEKCDEVQSLFAVFQPFAYALVIVDPAWAGTAVKYRNVKLEIVDLC